jgi:hypothetical protein
MPCGTQQARTGEVEVWKRNTWATPFNLSPFVQLYPTFILPLQRGGSLPRTLRSKSEEPDTHGKPGSAKLVRPVDYNQFLVCQFALLNSHKPSSSASQSQLGSQALLWMKFSLIPIWPFLYRNATRDILSVLNRKFGSSDFGMGKT